MKPLLWCDLETTGLDEKKDYILEIAIVATDEQLKVEALWQTAIYYSVAQLDVILKNALVRSMHTQSGLVAAVTSRDTAQLSGIALLELSKFIHDHHLCGRPMAGSNPSFDRKFLKECLAIDQLFHYRSFDMNTIYMLAGIDKDKDLPPVKHRAVDDIYRDLEILRRVHVTLE